MERTQIYLSKDEMAELDRRARASGTTRSHLIREAVGQYLGRTWDPDAFIAALEGFSGIWADRDDAEAIHAGLKDRSRESLERLRRDSSDKGVAERGA